MLDILRDPAWQFIGTLLALIAIGISLWIVFAQRSKKRLLVETVAHVPLVAFDSKGIPGLRIMFNDSPVENASVLLVRMQNIGNVPVLASDFEQPISLEFEEGARVLNADIGQTKPKHLPIKVAFADRSVLVERHLLNPGDAFTCRALIQNSKGKYTAKARVAGVLELETKRQVLFAQPLVVIFSFAIIVAAFYLTPKPMSFRLLDIRPEEIPYLLLVVVGGLVLFISTLFDLRSRTRRFHERFLLFGDDDA